MLRSFLFENDVVVVVVVVVHHKILKVSLLRNTRKSCCLNKLDLLIEIRHCEIFCILWLSNACIHMCILIEILTACVDMWNALISLHYILKRHKNTKTHTHSSIQHIEIMPLNGSHMLKQIQLG